MDFPLSSLVKFEMCLVLRRCRPVKLKSITEVQKVRDKYSWINIPSPIISTSVSFRCMCMSIRIYIPLLSLHSSTSELQESYRAGHTFKRDGIPFLF